MFTTLVLAMMISQQDPNKKEVREPNSDAYLAKLDPFVAKAIKPDPRDTPLKKLQKERVLDRAIAVTKVKEIVQIGKWDPDFYTNYIKLQTVLWENMAELLDAPADKLKCYQLRLDAMKEAENSSQRASLAAPNRSITNTSPRPTASTPRSTCSK